MDETPVIVTVCPSAMIQAPVATVWQLMTRPEGFDTWVDGRLEAAEPPGPARAGQRLRLSTWAAGIRFRVLIEVREVDAGAHRLRMLVRLPFGIVNDQTTTMAEALNGQALVRFG